MKSIVLVAALSFSAAFAAFWMLYGKDLAWDVSANGSYWYSEDFSTRGKIIVTSAFSALIAAVAAVSFGPRMQTKSILAGGNSGDSKSPYFNDQGEMYSKGEFKDVLFYPEDIGKHTKRKYHPGQ